MPPMSGRSVTPQRSTLASTRVDVELLEQHGRRAEEDAAEEVRDQHRHVRERAQAGADAVGPVAARLRARERRPEEVAVREHHALRGCRTSPTCTRWRRARRARRARRGRAGAARRGARRGASGSVGAHANTGMPAAAPASRATSTRFVSQRSARGPRVLELPRRLLGRRAHAHRHDDAAEPPHGVQHRDDRGLVRGHDADGIARRRCRGARATPRARRWPRRARRRTVARPEDDAAGVAAPPRLVLHERRRRDEQRFGGRPCGRGVL